MQKSKDKISYSHFRILFFVVALCFTCALILAITAFGLEHIQQNAKDFDQRKQMLIAAKILDHAGFFCLLQTDGRLQRARYVAEEGLLVPDLEAPKAEDSEIKQIADSRIRPLLTDNQGEIFTLEEKNLDLLSYLSENKKKGYAELPYKLFYAILSNDSAHLADQKTTKHLAHISAIIIPVSGFGLWAPIYGYIAIAPDGDKVIGTTWYEHGETPGLGANITEFWWQKQFYGKSIFQEFTNCRTDFQTADMGIIVVKGKVKDVFGNTSKSKSAVDGMSGATLTGDGVTTAYRNSLTPYRAFLIKLRKKVMRAS